MNLYQSLCILALAATCGLAGCQPKAAPEVQVRTEVRVEKVPVFVLNECEPNIVYIKVPATKAQPAQAPSGFEAPEAKAWGEGENVVSVRDLKPRYELAVFGGVSTASKLRIEGINARLEDEYTPVFAGAAGYRLDNDLKIWGHIQTNGTTLFGVGAEF